MTRHYSSTRPIASPFIQTDDFGRHTPDSVNLDAFVTNIYLPHVKLRKQSWRVDERIAGSICPRHSKRGNLPTYNATKLKTGCTGCRRKV